MLGSALTQAQVLAAIIAGIIAIILALWNFFTGKKAQAEIEILKNELAQKKSENDARREYEFEAKKRLYHEYEPLLFQLMEASENALHRIQSIARTAKHGNLNENGWLSQFNYYTRTTLYKLFAPIAIYQIMQKKLTLVDITLDKSIGLRYKLSKQLYLTYTDDFEFAGLDRALEYDPNNIDWQEKRKAHPAIFWRQGLPMGLLDKTIDVLIEKSTSGEERVISYGEFEKKLGNIGNDKSSDINLSRDIFFNFHPQNRPVLWRILIAQSFLLKALLELKDKSSEHINSTTIGELMLKYSKDSNPLLKWTNSEGTDIEEPFKVAVEYFNKKF